MAITGVAPAGIFGALLYLWAVVRSLLRVILATTIGAGLAAFLSLLIIFAIDSPLRTLLTQFSG